MDDISTFVWIGVAVLWLLTRLVRGGVKKANRELGKRVRTPQRTPQAAATPGRTRVIEPGSSSEAATAKPIEPR